MSKELGVLANLQKKLDSKYMNGSLLRINARILFINGNKWMLNAFGSFILKKNIAI